MQTPINKFFPKSKTLSLDKFIANALYNKKFGYYTQNIPFGKKGDFITSPEISGLFSEMLGVWIVALWEHLNKPKKFNIIELGPGSGKMSKDLISVFKKFPDFYNSSNLFLYEKSSLLKKVQQNKLKNEKVFWINSFKKINSGPAIFIGNEFFDAIPIKQFKRKNNIFYEKYVRLEKEKQIKTFFRIINSNYVNKLELIDYFKKNSFIEYPKQGFIELDKILKVIKKLKGGLLLIDYGFLNSKNKDTLQSVKDHKKNHIFKNVGNADITSLVNFDLLKKFLEHRGLKSNEVITQGFFLKKLGILFRADNLGRNLSFKQKSDLYYRIQRLINPKQMGELFKVIFAFKLDKKFTLGFY